MTDLVYPLGKGSLYKDFELRMSLRSVCSRLRNVRDIYIIGERPPWIHSVTHIPFADQHKITDHNIMDKIAAACRTESISDTFLMMNDDHYFQHNFEADKFPYFYNKTMAEYLGNRRSEDAYKARVKNSFEYLQAKELPTKFFDIHYPILYNKSAFLEHVVGALEWTNTKGYVLKSVYANAMKIEGVKIADYKSQQPPPKTAPVFSSLPYMKAAFQRTLIEMFPEKCKFETDEPGY